MRSVLMMLAVAALVLSGSVAMGQYYAVPTTVYSPVIAPAPVTVYSPVVAPAPVTVYRPAPVTVYRPAPVTAYRPVTVYRPAPVVAYPPATVYYRPEIRVPGQPVRNLLRAIVP